MGRKKKDLNVADPSEICGDGSCGCGCDGFIETEKVLSQEKIREIRSSSEEESLGTTGNPAGRKGVKK